MKMDHYPAPINFVTIIDQMASRAVLLELDNYLSSLEQRNTNTHQCSTFSNSSHLLNAYDTIIDAKLTVVLFDVPNQTKTYKPLHITQIDSQRPPWANSPQWAIKINFRHATNKKVIRNCAQQMTAWFRQGIKTAIPGQSYPWGPANISERQSHMLTIAKQLHSP